MFEYVRRVCPERKKQAPDDKKFCCNCRHYDQHGFVFVSGVKYFGICNWGCFNTSKYDLVTGQPKLKGATPATIERTYGPSRNIPDKCGIFGNNFEPKGD